MPKEKKKSQVQESVETCHRRTWEACTTLLRLFPDWILDIKDKGDPTWKPGRDKKKREENFDADGDENFGLAVTLTVLDIKKKIKKTDMIVRWRSKKLTSLVLKAMKKNPVIADLRKLYRNRWILLECGGTAGDPEYFAIIQMSDFPDSSFTILKDGTGKWAAKGRISLTIPEGVWHSTKSLVSLMATGWSEFERIRA